MTKSLTNPVAMHLRLETDTGRQSLYQEYHGIELTIHEVHAISRVQTSIYGGRTVLDFLMTRPDGAASEEFKEYLENNCAGLMDEKSARELSSRKGGEAAKLIDAVAEAREEFERMHTGLDEEELLRELSILFPYEPLFNSRKLN
ncbi:hypothetical protein [Sutterella sp.]|uniref:hypothetical protein n=1 Tax=Sutterella sp. TaxID=1981025 RepID=UPI0026E0CFA8|nr:hypothetical protein [Sutterella sp.]MDO5532976.1 hypothetical protein [Sutterella sp.]